MFDLWVPITLGAAFCQNIRSALQKHLKSSLSTGGATFVRFFYGLPFALVYLAVVQQTSGTDLPQPTTRFWVFALLGGLTQILATALLVYLFSFRNFAVGTTYAKTETVQAAAFGLLILSDTLTLGSLAAILVSLAGVMAISAARQDFGLRSLFTSWTQKTALIGLCSGAFFGLSAVSYRSASLSLEGGFLLQAAFTLAVVLSMQTLGMGLYLRWRQPGQFGAVLRQWKPAGLVGLSGMLGSVGWFTAMTLENAAHVKALGQVELVFTFIVSVLFFKERTNRTELVGILLVVGGILLLLLGT
ncbi:MAG: EamA family transporter [Candidatus Latescibacteria bacterium]|nr:EamA family transporter [Candidatus Latescibacterota bacterium]